MKRELLEQHFSPEQIKQRAGNFGQTLSYIEGWAVIQRLNEAFDGQWSFHVESHEVLESEVIVLGNLTAEGISKSQFGSSSVTRAKNTGDIISLADDLKAAATDALKKCATLFGVGLHLYSGDTVSTPAPKPVRTSTVMSDAMSGLISNDPPHVTENNYPDDGGNSGNENGRLSNKQYNYLMTLGNNHGLTKKVMDQNAIHNYGSAVAYLSKNDASYMIKEMLEHH